MSIRGFSRPDGGDVDGPPDLVTVSSADLGFQLRSERSGTVTVVRIEGEVDFATARAFRSLLESVLAAGTGWVVVEAGSTFFDVAAAFALAKFARQAQCAGRTVVLAGPASGLYRVLDVFPNEAGPARYRSLAEAIAAADREQDSR